jgi:hypothetical protein
MCDLYTRCADYLIDHIQECSLEPSYAELSNEEMVVENRYFYESVEMAAVVRGSLAGMMFDKSLRLPAA